MSDAAYRATLDRLFGLRRFGMRPGLEVMHALLDGLDHPERSWTAIHVAGSKGKGSVSAIVAEVLRAGGRRVGLYTSPHLVSYRERVRVDGAPVPRAAVTEGIRRIEGVAAKLARSGAIDRAATFFEITTAFAFDHFRSERVEDAVIEVGLGGRLDATNVVGAPVGIVTTIELEHTEILGPTLADIAREKAGILHAGMQGIVGELRPEARREVERVATAEGVPLVHLGRELRVEDRSIDERGQALSIVTPRGVRPGLRLPLFGPHQADNAALAVAAVEAYERARGIELPETAYAKGLAAVAWRARLERLATGPDLYVDVAHTPESARAVGMGLVELRPFLDPTENVVLFGCLSDKRVEPILEILAPLATTLVAVPLAPERAMPVDTIRRAAIGRFPKIVVAPDVGTGLTLARAATAREGFTLVLGSDYLAGDVIRAREGDPDDEPDLSDPAGPVATSERDTR